MPERGVHELPATGHYIASEVGRLAGVSGNTIGQWARRGLIHASHKTSGRFPLVYSFQDVAEALIVHELLERRASHAEIRETIRNLRVHYGSWPLTHANLATAPGGQIVARADEALYDIGRLGWQQVNPDALTSIVGLLQSGGWATRKFPDVRHIEVNPRVLSGRPTIRGRRLPVGKVAHLASTPDGQTVLRDDYGLSTAEIRDACRWWQATEEYEKAAA